MSVNDSTQAAKEIYFELWPSPPQLIEGKRKPEHTDSLTSDDKLMLKVAKRKNKKFRELYDTDLLLSQSIENGRPVFCYQSNSEADAALVFELAYWTNGNAEQMRRIAFSSKRLRGKWKDGRGAVTWLDNEISNALTTVDEGFEDASVIRYLDRRGAVVVDRVVKELLTQHRFLTFDDTEEIYHHDGKVYQANGEAVIKQEVQRLLKHKTTNHLVNEIINAVRRLTFVRREDARAPLNLIPLRNGVLDIETGCLTPWSEHDPGIPFFSRHEGAYIPELLLEDTTAQRFLESTFPAHEGESELPIIQEFAGSCFYRKSLYKKALQLLGAGDNGKSVFLKQLEFAVGRNAISTRTLYDLAKNRFAFADLYHKTANIQADIGGGVIQFTGQLKTLTGGDLVSAEKKGLPSFTFTNEATLIYSANELAELKRPDPVFYERFVLVEMQISFVDDPKEENECQRDPFLEEKLSQEREIDWFTTWAIEGLKRLLDNGHYTETKGSKDVMARWVSRTDSLKAFVDSSQVQEVPGVDVTKTAYYEA